MLFLRWSLYLFVILCASLFGFWFVGSFMTLTLFLGDIPADRLTAEQTTLMVQAGAPYGHKTLFLGHWFNGPWMLWAGVLVWPVAFGLACKPLLRPRLKERAAP